ncbi:MAG: outer membrane lipoprotein carrier protein LolA [Deltaproteobacteria bacterium]|nr:outer membrane lipoprotein carrier protein LolA [Deltaproteobacteria bacterium]
MVNFIYTRLKTVISVILFTVLISPATMAETKVSQVLDKILEAHRTYSAGMSVPYEREILTRSMAMLDDMGSDIASGIFFFREPDMLKVEQKVPAIEYVISNGKNIWFYEPDKKSASKMDSIGRSLSIISMIFTGLKNPEESFNITLLEPDGENYYELTLIPDETWEEIDNIKILVSKKDYIIYRMEIIDITGNLTRFKLGAFEQKKGLEAGFFDFAVPDGVRVIEEE